MPIRNAAPDLPSTPFRRFRRRFLKQRLSVVMAGVLVVVILVAIFAPQLAPFDPYATDTSKRFDGPNRTHWLGNDSLGRDMLSRLIYGTRISIVATFQANTLALLIGVPIGLIGGYFRGFVDVVLMRLVDALMAFPGLILALAIVGLLGPSLTNAMIAIGIVFSPRYARVVRGSTLAVMQETYIDAARGIGARGLFILRRHVLPNILSPLIVITTLSFGQVLLVEAGLSFLGFGAQPPDASLGALLSNSFTYMQQAPWNVVTPGMTIMLVVLAFNIVGDGIRDTLGRERRSA